MVIEFIGLTKEKDIRYKILRIRILNQDPDNIKFGYELFGILSSFLRQKCPQTLYLINS